MRQRYCKVCGGWHDLDAIWPAECVRDFPWLRSGFPAPMVIGDSCEFTSTLDGSVVTSKRAWEKQVRAAGCEVVGNDSSYLEPKRPKYKPDEAAIDTAIQKTMAQHGLN